MALIMLAVSILLFCSFSFIGNFRKENVEKKLLETVTNQVVTVLKANSEKLEDAKKLFENDYLNRAQNLAYIISETMENNPSNDELRQLAERIKVTDIHIVNEEGIVTKSTEEKSIGINFYEEDELKEFIPLIESQDEDDYYIDMDGYDLKNQKDMIYVGVKLFHSEKGILQIAITPRTLAAYEQKSSIANTIESMPVRDYVTIFAVDGKTGKLLGISKDKSQILEIGEENEIEDTVTALRGYIDTPGKIKINGQERLIKVQEYDGNLVAVTSDLDALYSSLPQTVGVIGLVVGILVTISIYCLYKLIDFFVIKDVEQLVNGVNEFANGNRDVKFYASKSAELDAMSNALNRLVDILESRPQRIAKVLSMIGNNVAVYEYFEDLNQFFYSDNLPNLLGVDEEECEKMIYNKFIETVKSSDFDSEKEIIGNETITTKSGRYLKMQTLITKNTSYALIRDVSEERERYQKLSDELCIANERAARDVLTGLYNRDKIQELIDGWFSEEGNNGILILMDLDNFKKVNDEKGHPIGDKLLRQFGDLLFKQFRSSDIKARIGGDEFVVFIPNSMDLSALKGKLERFLVACRETLKVYYEEQKVSVSIGVAYSNRNVHSYEELYKRADSAMYVTKKHGKDGFYINEDNIICMRDTCINCREYCKRREAIFHEAISNSYDG